MLAPYASATACLYTALPTGQRGGDAGDGTPAPPRKRKSTLLVKEGLKEEEALITPTPPAMHGQWEDAWAEKPASASPLFTPNL